MKLSDAWTERLRDAHEAVCKLIEEGEHGAVEFTRMEVVDLLAIKSAALGLMLRDIGIDPEPMLRAVDEERSEWMEGFEPIAESGELQG